MDKRLILPARDEFGLTNVLWRLMTASLLLGQIGDGTGIKRCKASIKTRPGEYPFYPHAPRHCESFEAQAFDPIPTYHPAANQALDATVEAPLISCAARWRRLVT